MCGRGGRSAGFAAARVRSIVYVYHRHGRACAATSRAGAEAAPTAVDRRAVGGPAALWRTRSRVPRCASPGSRVVRRGWPWRRRAGSCDAGRARGSVHATMAPRSAGTGRTSCDIDAEALGRLGTARGSRPGGACRADNEHDLSDTYESAEQWSMGREIRIENAMKLHPPGARAEPAKTPEWPHAIERRRAARVGIAAADVGGGELRGSYPRRHPAEHGPDSACSQEYQSTDSRRSRSDCAGGGPRPSYRHGIHAAEGPRHV